MHLRYQILELNTISQEQKDIQTTKCSLEQYPKGYLFQSWKFLFSKETNDLFCNYDVAETI